MGAIAGKKSPRNTNLVVEAVKALGYRAGQGLESVESAPWVMVQSWNEYEAPRHQLAGELPAVMTGQLHNWQQLVPGATCPLEAITQAYREQGPSFLSKLDGEFALAIVEGEQVFVARDRLGVVPCYVGVEDGKVIAFATEAKALMQLDIVPEELPPGSYWHPEEGLVSYFDLKKPKALLDDSPAELATGLRSVLVAAISKRLSGPEAGAWLSGGLDSSVMTCLAARQVAKLKTFCVGLEGAPDLESARLVADFVGTEHHELIPTKKLLLEALPQVIFHMESFDALLLRSSLTNFLVGRLASDHVPAVFSGEGGDELFAGYDYLKGMPPNELPDELMDITNRLHNTALQRVDRCSMGSGLTAYVPFVDRDVVEYALAIPHKYKLYRGEGKPVEKWILRKAVEGLLPEPVLWRKKAKFWEGAGVQDVLAEYAEETISDGDFARERKLQEGQPLNTKEELMYYRLFKEQFGEELAQQVGRTKGAPVDA